jgi:hypothetical protein
MINKELQKLSGTPCDASSSCQTRPVPVSGPGNFSSMGSFAPRKGANTHGNYIVNGVGGGSSKKMSY